MVMGQVLGFRAEPKGIHWAVVEGTRRVPILVKCGNAAAPVNLAEASALSWYSGRVKLEWRSSRMERETHRPIL